MYIGLHNPKSNNTGNSGSCSALVSYLEKENEINDLDLDERMLFFDQKSDMVSSAEVINRIDNNVAKLGKDEARFYMISINPSQQELKHIAQKVTGRNVSDLSQMTDREKKMFEKSLQDYSRSVMNEYAGGFNKGLTGDDILYFGKVEHERKYDRLSEEVKSGLRKAGELKEGFQSHIHIVVSRKDMTNKIRLSPFANHKNSKNQLNGKEVQVGFNRKEFYTNCEKRFDEQFKYTRNIRQSFYYRNSFKNMAGAVARSYANQMTGGAYSKVRYAKNNVEDPLSALTGFAKKDEQIAAVAKIAQLAARPDQIALEVVKKLPSAISKAATLTI